MTAPTQHGVAYRPTSNLEDTVLVTGPHNRIEEIVKLGLIDGDKNEVLKNPLDIF